VEFGRKSALKAVLRVREDSGRGSWKSHSKAATRKGKVERRRLKISSRRQKDGRDVLGGKIGTNVELFPLSMKTPGHPREREVVRGEEDLRGS